MKISKIHRNQKKQDQPWSNRECTEIVAERAEARKRIHKYPTQPNKIPKNMASEKAK